MGWGVEMVMKQIFAFQNLHVAAEPPVSQSFLPSACLFLTVATSACSYCSQPQPLSHCTTCSVLCTKRRNKTRQITFIHITSASQLMARKPWPLCGWIHFKCMHPIVLNCKTRSKQITKCMYFSYSFKWAIAVVFFNHNWHIK
jgi:hypothetical protein